LGVDSLVFKYGYHGAAARFGSPFQHWFIRMMELINKNDLDASLSTLVYKNDGIATKNLRVKRSPKSAIQHWFIRMMEKMANVKVMRSNIGL
jgi:hypothetical protein